MIQIASAHPYQTQFQAFFDAIDAGENMELTDLETILRTHRIVFAADESAHASQAITL